MENNDVKKLFIVTYPHIQHIYPFVFKKKYNIKISDIINQVLIENDFNFFSPYYLKFQHNFFFKWSTRYERHLFLTTHRHMGRDCKLPIILEELVRCLLGFLIVYNNIFYEMKGANKGLYFPLFSKFVIIIIFIQLIPAFFIHAVRC